VGSNTPSSRTTGRSFYFRTDGCHGARVKLPEGTEDWLCRARQHLRSPVELVLACPPRRVRRGALRVREFAEGRARNGFPSRVRGRRACVTTDPGDTEAARARVKAGRPRRQTAPSCRGWPRRKRAVIFIAGLASDFAGLGYTSASRLSTREYPGM